MHAPLESHLVADASLTAVAFDPTEELVWVATSSGYVRAVSLPSLAPHAAFLAHDEGAVALLAHDGGFAAATPEGLRFWTKGGVPRSTMDLEVDVAAGGIRCATWVSGAQALVSGAETLLFDAATSQVLSRSPSEALWCVARCDSRGGLAVLAGGRQDAIVLDPRAWLQVASLPGPCADEGATVCDVALGPAGSHLAVVCSCSHRLVPSAFGAAAVVEPWPAVRVVDLRMHKAVGDVPFPGGAFRAVFHPQLSATCIVASPDGFVGVVDCRGVAGPDGCERLPCAAGSLACADVAPTGTVAALAALATAG